MYSHTSVTMIPNAPYHSMYFGAPCVDDLADELVVEEQVQRRDAADHHADADAERARLVPEDHVDAEQRQQRAEQVQQEDAERRADHDHLELAW